MTTVEPDPWNPNRSFVEEDPALSRTAPASSSVAQELLLVSEASQLPLR